MSIFIKTFSVFMLTLLIADCSSYDFTRRIVQQGNLLPEKKIKQLKPGMHKNEVAAIMGTSLLSPTFNDDRWDYAYTWRKGSGKDTIHEKISLYFSNNKLTRIQR